MQIGDKITTTGEERFHGTVNRVFGGWKECGERIREAFSPEWCQDFQAYWTVAEADQEWCEVTLMPHSGRRSTRGDMDA